VRGAIAVKDREAMNYDEWVEVGVGPNRGRFHLHGVHHLKTFRIIRRSEAEVAGLTICSMCQQRRDAGDLPTAWEKWWSKRTALEMREVTDA
jgi:hypothetical protein